MFLIASGVAAPYVFSFTYVMFCVLCSVCYVMFCVLCCVMFCVFCYAMFCSVLCVLSCSVCVCVSHPTLLVHPTLLANLSNVSTLFGWPKLTHSATLDWQLMELSVPDL